MAEILLTERATDSRPLWLLTESELPRWLDEQPAGVASWGRSHGFQAERHRVLSYPASHGAVGRVMFALGALKSTDDLRLWHAAGLTERIPAGEWHVANSLRADAATHF